MFVVCTDRVRYSFDEAKKYVSSVPASSSHGRVSYVVASACAGCGSWHVRIVERALKIAS